MPTMIKELSKKEQLKQVFTAELNKFSKEIMKYEEGYNSDYLDSDDIIADSVNVLLKEISIRTDLR